MFRELTFIRAAHSATVTVRGLVIGGAAGMAIVRARVHVTSGAGRPRVLQAVPFETLFAPWLTPAAASPARAQANLLRWLLAMRPPYRKDIHIPA